LKKPVLTAILILTCFPISVSAQDNSVGLPLPPKLKPALDARTPEELLDTFLGVPFREDGAIDEHGNYTLFGRPDKLFKEPGLNCSGFVLAASRLLFQKNIPLVVAVRDRLGDSGGGATLGQDWDFGWDLVLNVSEGLKRTLILPGGLSANPAAGNGLAPLGFDLHSPETWQELPGRIRPNYIYLVSLNRPTAQRGYILLHYHVGILLRTPDNNLYLYHSIKKQGVVRENLGNEVSRARFLDSNANIGNSRKHIFVVEVPRTL